MIIRASDLRQDAMTPLERELDDLIFQRDLTLSQLPECLREQELIEALAREVHRVIEQLVANPMNRSKNLLSSRAVDEKRGQLWELMEDKTIPLAAWKILAINFAQGYALSSKEREVLKKVWKDLVASYFRAYLIHVLEELDDLFLDKKTEEQEIMERYFSQPEEPSYRTEDPHQRKLFE